MTVILHLFYPGEGGFFYFHSFLTHSAITPLQQHHHHHGQRHLVVKERHHLLCNPDWSLAADPSILCPHERAGAGQERRVSCRRGRLQRCPEVLVFQVWWCRQSEKARLDDFHSRAQGIIRDGGGGGGEGAAMVKSATVPKEETSTFLLLLFSRTNPPPHHHRHYRSSPVPFFQAHVITQPTQPLIHPQRTQHSQQTSNPTSQ